MKNEPEWINRIVRHRKCLHRNITNGKLGASRKDPPVTVPFEWAVVANRFRRQSIAINRHIKLNTGLKVAALLQLAQTETMRMTKHPPSRGYGVAGE